MNEKNQQVSDEQIDALIRSGLWQDEQPLTADEEKLILGQPAKGTSLQVFKDEL